MLSIVVPVLNEAESLRELHRQISTTCDPAQIAFELILVDDGSTDASWARIRELSESDSRVRGLRFRRNFGKSSALMAGVGIAKGDRIMTLDADLQDDPAEIPRFLAKLDEGFDVVNGWKERRLDPWHKVYPSKVFNRLVGGLTGVRLHDHNCGFKLCRAEVWREVRLYSELHRFVPVLAQARGFRVTEIPVNHRPREFGHSKYGVRRFLRGFLDLLTVTFLTSFGHRPQHFLGGVGVLCVGLGSLGLGYLGIQWLLMNVFHTLAPDPIGKRPLLAYSGVLLLLGTQILSLGLLAELIVANTRREEHAYSIAESVGTGSPTSVA